MVYRVGFSVGRNIDEVTLALMAQSGISAVELKGRDYDFKALKTSADQSGIELYSMHLPFKPLEEFDIAVANSDIREKAINYLSELIKKAADIGIRKFVIHPSTPFTETLPREERKKNAMDVLDRLAEIAHGEAVVLAVENMNLSCLGNSADELLEIISVNDKLRVCFDVNHLLKNSHREFLQKLGSKIVHLHISDYDFVQERHWFPGEGNIDWPDLYFALQEIGYKGVWNYETSLSLRGTNPGERGRTLTWSDIYENAQEIFSGRQPQVIKE